MEKLVIYCLFIVESIKKKAAWTHGKYYVMNLPISLSLSTLDVTHNRKGDGVLIAVYHQVQVLITYFDIYTMDQSSIYI